MSLRRLLIANRGEIAVRIARTAERMGIETVGVYSEPDARAMHAEWVDWAVAIGGATPAESYLRGDALIEAALAMECDSVHPGYGFLAESPDFARAVSDAGLVWVGPDADQIALLGDKVAAKRVAEEAGVATTPAYPADALPPDLPMPVLVKAAAGGGGRGMRLVRSRDELHDAVEAATREAAAAFGDGAVFVEPYVEHARHVEVQVIADHHGNVIHLGERECSIQRRNQKLIEEAPSPGIDDATRHTLWASALGLAKAVGYRNAGTVEFLVGEGGAVGFLEVNTRLQVEHPVTEAVTGVDLVELQLRVAAGEPLPLTQDEVVFSGHAIEARLVAEDPAAGWLPSTGRIAAFDVDGPVRVDTGVGANTVVSPEYDSLLAKVIAHAQARDEAALVLRRALRTAHLGGPRTNRNTLVAILGEADFLAGRTTTDYLDHHPELQDATGPEGDERLASLVAAVVRHTDANRSAAAHWAFAAPGWRNLRTTGQRATWCDDRGRPMQIEEIWENDRTATMLVGPWPEPEDDGSLSPDGRRSMALRVLDVDQGGVAIEVDGVLRLLAATGSPADGITVTGAAGGVTWTLQPRFAGHDADEAGSGPVSPLPGTVIGVHTEAGSIIDDGDVLMVIEAMKMEHRIMATGHARVVAVHFALGDRVDAGDLLVELDHPEE